MSMELVLSTVEAASSIAVAVSVPLWLVVEGFVHPATSEPSAESPVCRAAMATSAGATLSRAHIMWLPSDPRPAPAPATPDADQLSGTRRV